MSAAGQRPSYRPEGKVTWKVTRTSFSREELAGVYAKRYLLPDGTRPEGRTFAATYFDLARHYRCHPDVMAAACAGAAGLFKAGKIIQGADGAVRNVEADYSPVEAARIIGVNVQTVYNWMRRGLIERGARVLGADVAGVVTGRIQRPKAGRPRKDARALARALTLS